MAVATKEISNARSWEFGGESWGDITLTYLLSPAFATYSFPNKYTTTRAVQPPEILYTVLSRSICKSYGRREEKCIKRALQLMFWKMKTPLKGYSLP